VAERVAPTAISGTKPALKLLRVIRARGVFRLIAVLTAQTAAGAVLELPPSICRRGWGSSSGLACSGRH
jgi:hypothetical protein